MLAYEVCTLCEFTSQCTRTVLGFRVFASFNTYGAVQISVCSDLDNCDGAPTNLSSQPVKYNKFRTETPATILDAYRA